MFIGVVGLMLLWFTAGLPGPVAFLTIWWIKKRRRLCGATHSRSAYWQFVSSWGWFTRRSLVLKWPIRRQRW